MQAVSEQQEQSPAGWHRLEGAGRPRGCHGRGTVLPGEACIEQPGSAELTPTRAARSNVAHGTAEQDGGGHGGTRPGWLILQSPNTSPCHICCLCLQSASRAGVTGGACLHRPSRPYGRFHGTAITAPGNTLLIKAKGLGCGRKDGWQGGSSPTQHRGLAGGKKSSAVRFGDLMPTGASPRKADKGSGSLPSNLWLEGHSRACQSARPQRHCTGQWSEEDQEGSPGTTR